VFSRRTKVVATLGPATDEPGVLEALVAAGIDCARLNCSHGTAEDLRRRAGEVRAVAGGAGRSVGLLFDLQGRSCGCQRASRPGWCSRGDRDVLWRADTASDDRIAVDFADFPRLVSERSEIVIGDGVPRLVVESSARGRLSLGHSRPGSSPRARGST